MFGSSLGLKLKSLTLRSSVGAFEEQIMVNISTSLCALSKLKCTEARKETKL